MQNEMHVHKASPRVREVRLRGGRGGRGVYRHFNASNRVERYTSNVNQRKHYLVTIASPVETVALSADLTYSVGN